MSLLLSSCLFFDYNLFALFIVHDQCLCVLDIVLSFVISFPSIPILIKCSCWFSKQSSQSMSLLSFTSVSGLLVLESPSSCNLLLIIGWPWHVSSSWLLCIWSSPLIICASSLVVICFMPHHGSMCPWSTIILLCCYSWFVGRKGILL